MTVSRPPLLEAKHVELHYTVRNTMVLDRSTATVRAVDDVSFTLDEGETLGVVGESGCGKTSLARCLLRLATPTAGTVHFRGHDITRASPRALRGIRREVQMVFQDPEASLNPRKRIGQIVGLGLRLQGIKGREVTDRARTLLGQVGLDPEHINRFPHEFSGGQRQRIGIARALAVQPSLIVLDEPVSALDVSVQAQVINLLDDLKDKSGLAYIFVAHDLSVVRHVSDRIAVMYLGKIVELTPAEALYHKPVHPYTAALLASVPVRRRAGERAGRGVVVKGEPANPVNVPSGCRFHPRCQHSTEICTLVEPPLMRFPGDRLAACHHPRNLSDSEVALAVRSPLSPLSTGGA